MVEPNPAIMQRAVVEHMVRQAVYKRLGKSVPAQVSAPNPLVVNVSARHCHLTQEAVDVIVTDDGAPADLLNYLRSNEIEVVIAPLAANN